MVYNWSVFSRAGVCLLCAGPAPQATGFCRGCWRDLPWLENPCPGCAMPRGDSNQCGFCLLRPPPWERTVAAFHYAYPVRQMVQLFKYRRQAWWARPLALSLARTIRRSRRRPLPDCLLPVPLHWRRYLRRGHNQAEELARVLGAALGLPVCAGLQRQRHTPAQTGLGAGQRRRNLAAAFRLTTLPPGQRVAIVDDVVTTGATAAAISRVLYAAGVHEVELWTVARTTLRWSGIQVRHHQGIGFDKLPAGLHLITH